MRQKEMNLLRQISKNNYNDEWFIDKAILSFKAQKEKTYTFFKDNSTDNFMYKYNWCQRPIDTTMSLRHFESNATVSCWMSESLAEEKGLEQITLDDFIYQFVKPIIEENIKLKKELNIKKCLICGNEFKAKRKNQVCCSEKCKIKRRNKLNYNRMKNATPENKQKMKESKKKYSEKNKEKINEYKKIYREKNKAKTLLAQRKWREKNKEHIKEYNKQYRMRKK